MSNDMSTLLQDASLLVVEGEPGWLLPVVPVVLKEWGADVVIAASFPQARQRLAQFDFSAAISITRLSRAVSMG